MVLNINQNFLGSNFRIVRNDNNDKFKNYDRNPKRLTQNSIREITNPKTLLLLLAIYKFTRMANVKERNSYYFRN